VRPSPTPRPIGTTSCSSSCEKTSTGWVTAVRPGCPSRHRHERANVVRTSDRARKCPRVTDVCCVDNRVSDPRTIRRSPLTDSNRRPPPYHAPRSATSGNPRQGFWLVGAVSAAIPFATGCHRLRPLCSINAPYAVVHEGNTRSSRCELGASERRTRRGLSSRSTTNSSRCGIGILRGNAFAQE
jgi:hypothetical protein